MSHGELEWSPKSPAESPPPEAYRWREDALRDATKFKERWKGVKEERERERSRDINRATDRGQTHSFPPPPPPYTDRDKSYHRDNPQCHSSPRTRSRPASPRDSPPPPLFPPSPPPDNKRKLHEMASDEHIVQTHPHCVHISGVPSSAEYNDIFNLMHKCGKIRRIEMLPARQTGGKELGAAFVQFENESAVVRALAMDGEEVQSLSKALRFY
jgi:hypothetical protein